MKNKKKPKPLLTLDEKRIQRGKLSEQNVVFSLVLPPPIQRNTDLFLKKMRDAFFEFLQKQKRKEETLFAGMAYERKNDSLLILFSLCPFGEKIFFPALFIKLGKNGEILSLEKGKSRHSSHSARRAHGQSEGQGE